MEPRNFPYIALLKNYLNGELTASESAELIRYLKGISIENDPEIEKVLEEVYKKSFEESPAISEDASQRILYRLLASTENTDSAKTTQFKKGKSIKFTGLSQRSWLGYAAAAILIIALPIILIVTGKKESQSFSVNSSTTINKILPGSNRATLKLANGKEIFLDSTQGNIVQEGAFTISNGDSKLNYQGRDNVVEYHTLSTPKAGEYKLQLPDGTNVWLNAASSITYPTVFTGTERNVKITGEVYFEVAKNPNKPFKVRVKAMEIAVLGTHFNVNAYEDEQSINTTLLEGLVKISSGSEQKMLHPGQKAVLSENNSFKILSGVDVDEVMAWKNGYFSFQHSDLPTIMRQFSRWYDVTVEYRGYSTNKRFVGEIPRNIELSQALKVLSAANIHFIIEGKKIIVTP